MQCISPILVKSKNHRGFVPCGSCSFCLQQKRADWSFRLNQELKVSSSAYFITLTYDEQHCTNTLDKTHLQLWFKKLRKLQAKVSKEKLRYYAVGEYGTRTNRPHYHVILFNYDINLVNSGIDVWQKGHTMWGSTTPASIHYVTKYVINKPGDYGNRNLPFALMSRKPGIGTNYLDTHKKWHREDNRTYAVSNGHKVRLPRFYKERIFSKLERQIMSIENIQEQDQVYLDELDRLINFHPSPDNYFDALVRKAHDQIKQKVNETNVL